MDHGQLQLPYRNAVATIGDIVPSFEDWIRVIRHVTGSHFRWAVALDLRRPPFRPEALRGPRDTR